MKTVLTLAIGVFVCLTIAAACTRRQARTGGYSDETGSPPVGDVRPAGAGGEPSSDWSIVGSPAY